MGAVKNAFHDEITNRCETCGVRLYACDTAPCDDPLCPIPDRLFAIAIEAATAAETVKLGSVHESADPKGIARKRAA